jgi:hypothetical protein
MKPEGRILRLLFEFQTEYIGNSKYITGNAFRHALSMPIDTSIGIFTENSRVFQPTSYEEFFEIRTKNPLLKPYFYFHWDPYNNCRAKKCYFKPAFVTFDLINASEDTIETIQDEKLIQFGGGRNKGYGLADLVDWVWIDYNKLEYPTEATHITLISPILYIPNDVHKYNCRKGYEIFWNHGRKNKLSIIPPGQFFRIKQDRNIEKIAKKGILKKSLLGKFGYGEYLLHNWQKNGGN